MSTSIRGIYRPEWAGPRIIDADGKPVDDLPIGSSGSSDMVALEGTTAFHKRIIQEVPDFRLPQVSVDDLPFGSGGSSDVVALDFTETAAWSQELSQP
jgi:hypothetical protein